MLASIIGEGEMGELEKDYLAFGKAFESRFIHQGKTEERTLNETLNIAWELLKILPVESLTHLRVEDVSKYIQ